MTAIGVAPAAARPALPLLLVAGLEQKLHCRPAGRCRDPIRTAGIGARGAPSWSSVCAAASAGPGFERRAGDRDERGRVNSLGQRTGLEMGFQSSAQA